jgi:hypothetical protein
MTPKEKAKELVDSFYQLFPLDKDVNTTDGELNWKYNDWNQSKKAALIAVDEIYNSGLLMMVDDEQYWYDVKQEIQLL